MSTLKELGLAGLSRRRCAEVRELDPLHLGIDMVRRASKLRST
jgi:hypothetical protein